MINGIQNKLFPSLESIRSTLCMPKSINGNSVCKVVGLFTLLAGAFFTGTQWNRKIEIKQTNVSPSCTVSELQQSVADLQQRIMSINGNVPEVFVPNFQKMNKYILNFEDIVNVYKLCMQKTTNAEETSWKKHNCARIKNGTFMDGRLKEGTIFAMERMAENDWDKDGWLESGSFDNDGWLSQGSRILTKFGMTTMNKSSYVDHYEGTFNRGAFTNGTRVVSMNGVRSDVENSITIIEKGLVSKGRLNGPNCTQTVEDNLGSTSRTGMFNQGSFKQGKLSFTDPIKQTVILEGTFGPRCNSNENNCNLHRKHFGFIEGNGQTTMDSDTTHFTINKDGEMKETKKTLA